MTPFLSFHIKKQTTTQRMIYCRVTFNSERSTEYRTGIRVDTGYWPALPPEYPGSLRIQQQLLTIRQQHADIAARMEHPTANAIKAAFLEMHQMAPPKVKVRLLSTVYSEYITALTTPPKKQGRGEVWKMPAEKTVGSYKKTGEHLMDFLKATGQVRLSLDELRTSHGYRFSDYLFDLGIQADTVARHIRHLSAAITYAKRYDDTILTNPLSEVEIKGTPPKRIDYLSEMDLIRLSSLKLRPKHHTVRNWALLMAYTGLDYHDALKVTGNLGEYYQQGMYGDTIVFQRLKYDHAPQWGVCHIPVLPTTKELLSDVLNWSRPKLKVINTHLKTIGQKLNLAFDLHSKIFRKTAGLVLLLHYEDIYLVQKAMGHQSIKTTEAHYLNMPAEIVHKAMKRKMIRDSEQGGYEQNQRTA